MLAYDEFGKNGSGRYYDGGRDEGKKVPTALVNELKADGFAVSNSDAKNYFDTDYKNVSYVFANKIISFNGSVRTLVAVIIRGTDGEEWKGNMDITGSSYNASCNNHYSFEKASNDLRTKEEKGLNKCLSDNKITNPVYLITGHSCGAAVANLLAETLTSNNGVSNVFAYTFAMPNNTKKPNTSRKNIRNFCFNDDFVPQVPLSKWGYGKHGIAYTKIAETLYSNSNNSKFKEDMDKFLSDSEKGSASFDLESTTSLLDYVYDKWGSVDVYYTKKRYTSAPLIKTTLYKFFRNVVAPAAMEGKMGMAALGAEAIKLLGSDYAPIARFFIAGNANAPFMSKRIYHTHVAFTYYDAIKHGLFT
jgi:hypothetical protein